MITRNELNNYERRLIDLIRWDQNCDDFLLSLLKDYNGILYNQIMTDEGYNAVLNDDAKIEKDEMEFPAEFIPWTVNNQPHPKMLYRKAYWRQVLFVRDTVYLTLLPYNKNRNYNKVFDKLKVVSSHRSKSVDLPVYRIKFKNLELIMRNNFYDWKISIKAKKSIKGFEKYKLFDENKKISSVYCEGFDDSWVYDSYAKNNKMFTVEIGNDNLFYTFIHLLKVFYKINE